MPEAGSLANSKVETQPPNQRRRDILQHEADESDLLSGRKDVLRPTSWVLVETSSHRGERLVGFSLPEH
jgi:hypothetical protein